MLLLFLFSQKKEFLLIPVRATVSNLVNLGTTSSQEQTRVRVWSRVLPVSPYLVLLHQ
jgi:hypothetical protein